MCPSAKSSKAAVAGQPRDPRLRATRAEIAEASEAAPEGSISSWSRSLPGAIAAAEDGPVNKNNSERSVAVAERSGGFAQEGAGQAVSNDNKIGRDDYQERARKGEEQQRLLTTATTATAAESITPQYQFLLAETATGSNADCQEQEAEHESQADDGSSGASARQGPEAAASQPEPQLLRPRSDHSGIHHSGAGGLYAAVPPIAAAREALQQHLLRHRAHRTARRNNLYDDIADVGSASTSVDSDDGEGSVGGGGVGSSSNKAAAAGGGGDVGGTRSGRTTGLTASPDAPSSAASGLSVLPRSSRPPAALGQRFRALLQLDAGGAEDSPQPSDADADAGASTGSGGDERAALKRSSTTNASAPAETSASFAAAHSPDSLEQRLRQQQRPKAAAPSPPPPLPSSARRHFQPHPYYYQQQQQQRPPPGSVLPLPPRFIPSNSNSEPPPLPPATLSFPEPANWGRSRAPAGGGARGRAPRQPFGSLPFRVPWPAASLLSFLLRRLKSQKPAPPRVAAPPSPQQDGTGVESSGEAAGNGGPGGGAEVEGAAGLTAVGAAAAATGGGGGGEEEVRIYTTDRAHEALARIEETAMEQARLAVALDEWAEDHPVAHVMVQLQVLRIQLQLLRTQTSLWRPAELLNGRMALLGLTAGLYQEATAGTTLVQQATRHPLSIPSAFALVVLLTAVHRQVQPRMKTRGLLMSARAHRWLGRAAMVGFVWAVAAEAADPAHRPALQQLREWAMGIGGGAVMGPAAMGHAVKGAAGHGGADEAGPLDVLWMWW
ncbi:hypothetical protein PLESTB_000499800 [Pleodorina starrii]|uniref:Uncharacterized protein n=1 Tax=Pleodorina starrii TaxID=330485 RepID=A0A9W6BGM3_9CHLO|nr:hypothetical protein PLESTB_000499800 [Pleodorina starrii]